MQEYLHGLLADKILRHHFPSFYKLEKLVLGGVVNTGKSKNTIGCT